MINSEKIEGSYSLINKPFLFDGIAMLGFQIYALLLVTIEVFSSSVAVVEFLFYFGVAVVFILVFLCHFFNEKRTGKRKPYLPLFYAALVTSVGYLVAVVLGTNFKLLIGGVL